MKNLLITGSSGYIGSMLVAALERHPQVENLVGIDLNPPRHPGRKLRFYRLDVRGPLLDLVKRYRIDTVVHTAYVLPPLHNKALMEDINLKGTVNILDSCRKANVQHLLYTGSTTAYGFHKDNPVPMDENQPLRGNDDFTYSKNKKEIELLLKDFKENHQAIRVTILRASFVIGPRADNPLSRYIRKRLVVVPVDSQPIQFVQESDLLKAILLCLEQKVSGVFNIAGAGAVSIPEMANALGNRVIFLPFFLLKLLNEIAWQTRLQFFTEMPSAGLAMIRYPWIATSAKFIRQTGFAFGYTSREAFESFAQGG